jgi:hypothetical protein
MAAEIRISEDPAHAEGGHAIIEVTGIGGYPGRGRFRIHREGYVHANLGPSGWQVAEILLEPDRSEGLDGGVRLYVGPALVRWLETGPVTISLPDAEFTVAAFWPDIAPLHEGAAGGRRFAGGDALPVAETPKRPPPPIAPTPPAEPSRLTVAPERLPHSDEPKPKRGSGLVMLGALVVVLLIGGGGAWWYLEHETSPAPPPAPPAAPVAPAPNLLAMSAGDIIAQAKSPEEIYAAARQVQQAGDHDKALVLLEEAALRGHAPSNTALARLYDPNGFPAGKPFKSPDPRQAARYYKAAEEGGDAEAKQPRQALKDRLTQDAASGNVTAQTALKDFW